MTPLKRVDFDHKGARNTQNRGVSGYEPICWDEALDIIVDEITRCRRDEGPGSILTTASSHHLWGNIGYRHSAYNRFMNLMGIRTATTTPIAGRAGTGAAFPCGASATASAFPSSTTCSKTPSSTPRWSSSGRPIPRPRGGIYSAFESTIRRFWLKELGIKMVFVDPYFNHTAGLFADKWFAPRPGTDVAFGLAIAHTWLAEGTYDKEYVAERTHRLRRVARLRARDRGQRAQDAGLGRV